MKKGFALIVLFFSITCSYAQVSTVTFNKQSFFNPTVESMGYLMSHLDTATWNKTLLTIGFAELPANMKVNVLEYKKKIDGFSEYIGFDDSYGVFTVIWKDESGNNSFATGLRKKLKKNAHTTPGTYRVDYKGVFVIIGIESNKDKGINEMITMEIERK